ncbi:50S ribosomal protein L24 [Candidatus Microgenomates bacterium]|nr:50S ribosomal protein L24 [Candidatus Microgenomates bacterium]
MLKFKAGDTVKVTLGKDKGREGKIEKVFPKKMLALIPEINIYKKHVKAAMTRDKKGGIFEIPRPMPFSKIALVCPNCKKVTRAGFELNKDGKKIRICHKCGKEMK